MLTRDEVVWGFRFVLGRDPESEETIAAHMALPDWSSLRAGLMDSEEYRLRVGFQPFPERWVLASVLDGTRQMWVDLSDRHVSIKCLLGEYEPLETQFVRQNLKPGDVFVDIGANIGWYTLLASTILRPQDRIIAFEPRADTSGWLRRTLEANGISRQVTLHSCALGAKAGRAFISNAPVTDNPGGSFTSAERPGEGFLSAPVQMETLDSFALERLDFLKIDVEGAEPQVIEGAAETLARCRPMILSELHRHQLEQVSGTTPREYIAMLSSFGYRAVCLGPVRAGEDLTDFPSDWEGDVVNIGLIIE